MSDPRYRDPRLDPPPLREDDARSQRLGELESSNAMWGWVAGAVVLALVLVFVFTRSPSDSTSTATAAAACGHRPGHDRRGLDGAPAVAIAFDHGLGQQPACDPARLQTRRGKRQPFAVSHAPACRPGCFCFSCRTPGRSARDSRWRAGWSRSPCRSPP